MAGQNNYHYGETLADVMETACGQPIGWLLTEMDEHTGDDKETVLNDPDRCEDCEKVLVLGDA